MAVDRLGRDLYRGDIRDIFTFNGKTPEIYLEVLDHIREPVPMGDGARIDLSPLGKESWLPEGTELVAYAGDQQPRQTQNQTKPQPQKQNKPSIKDELVDLGKQQVIKAGVKEGAEVVGEAAGFTPGQVGGALGAAKAGYDAYKILDSNMSKEDKAKALKRTGEDTALAIGTGGISSLAQLADRKLLGGQTDKLRGKAEKVMNHPAMMVIDPVGLASRLGIDKALEKGLEVTGLGRKTTQQKQAERRKNLIEEDVAGYLDYLKNSPTSANKGGKVSSDGEGFVGVGENGWVNNVFAESRDEKDLRPEDVWGSEGMFETYGDDWLGGTYSEQDRRNISQALLDNNLIDERDGGIYVKDKEAALALAKEVVPNPGASTQNSTTSNTSTVSKQQKKPQGKRKPATIPGYLTQQPIRNTSALYGDLQLKPTAEERKSRLTAEEYGQALANIYEQNSRIRVPGA